MKYQHLLNIALAAILTAYAVLGTFTRYEADDYCQAVGVDELGIIGFTQSQYQNWQGRYSWTLVSLTLYDTLNDTAPAIIPALLIVGMVGGWLYALRPVRKDYALTLALVLTLGFITGLPNLWQSFMWMNSALNYALPLIVGLYFAGWLIRRWPSQVGSSLPVLVKRPPLSQS